ncbi:MAG: zinc-ribbon domain-containing protein [Ruthenibacterium sp.]
MKICPICGAAMQDGNQFCTSCGANAAETAQVAQQDSAVGAAAPMAETPVEAASDFTEQSGAAQDTAASGAARADGARPMYGGQPAYSAQSAYTQPVGQSGQQPYAGAGYQPIVQMGNWACEPVTMGQWLLNYLIIAIPVVNLVMLFIWGFGGSTKLSQRNWARATLIWMAIGIASLVLFIVLFGVLMFSGMSSYA